MKMCDSKCVCILFLFVLYIVGSNCFMMTMKLSVKSSKKIEHYRVQTNGVSSENYKAGVKNEKLRNDDKNSRRKAIGTYLSGVGAVFFGLNVKKTNALQPYVPPPKEGDCVDCLGVVDDLLAACSGQNNCISSQDDRPAVFREPWMYDEDEGNLKSVIIKLKNGVQSLEDERYKVKFLREDDRYLHAELFDYRTEAIDDMEFYLTPNDSLIQFRASRRNQSKDGGLNAKRLENIRIKERFEKLPVLRDRKRTFVFVESDQFDRFGPSLTENLFGKPIEASPDFQRGKKNVSKDEVMIYQYLEDKQK